ncbi:MAG: hypothetical protein NG740_00625 [Omnitrophica bacterium]|nr:hypothetical protein [Candidatus Omnitrophota bacterium]
MEKIRYEVDPHNRLVVVRSGRRARLSRFRKVLSGRFRIGKNNALSYHIKSPVHHGANIPHQVKFKGKWSLTKNHNLRLTLNKWGRRTFGDSLTIKGDIISANKNSILFAVTSKTKENTRSIYVLDLKGAWQADKSNRLTFRVKKEKGKHDILTFDGVWKVDKNYRVTYSYERAHLLRKSKKMHTIVLQGHWDIKDKSRLSYVLDRNTNSAFNFKTGLGFFSDNYIKYEVGIRLSERRRPVKRSITLYGVWKIRKNTGLTFEIKYGDKKIRAITFRANASFAKNGAVFLRLRNELGKDMGVSIKLSRKILKGEGEAFLKALRSKRESNFFVGAGGGW